MTKVFYKEINHCYKCPNNKDFWNKQGEVSFCVQTCDITPWDGIPDWCPLEDKQSNKCTCEKCTGIDVESTYEKVEKVVKAIEEKGKRQADFDRHKTDIL